MKTFLVCVILFIGYGALFYVVYSLYSFMKGRVGQFAPYVPSVGTSKNIMLDIARKRLAESDKSLTVVDLGSGTGSLLIPLAKEFPQHTFVGIEWDCIPLFVAMFYSRKLKNTHWHKQNFMTYSCCDADIVFCYLLKTMQDSVGLKLSHEIKNDCIVITELYPVNHLKLIQDYKPKLNVGIPVYKMKKK